MLFYFQLCTVAIWDPKIDFVLQMTDPLKFLADTKASPRWGETSELMENLKKVKEDKKVANNDDVPGINAKPS